MRRLMKRVLIVALIGWGLLAIPYFMVGPDWGQRAGESTNRTIETTDWRQLGADTADWTFQVVRWSLHLP